MAAYDFKTFAQMNLDLLFTDFPRLPGLGEEVFAQSFEIQLGGGAMVCPIVLSSLGCRAGLGTFLGEDLQSRLCRRLLGDKGFSDFQVFPSPQPHPVVVTSVFSWPEDRSFLAYNAQVNESCLDSDAVFAYLSDAKVVFAPEGHPEVARRLHDAGVKVVYDNGWSDDLSLATIRDLLPYVDVYMPNDKEARKIAGTDDLSQALEFLARHTANPVITTGKGGCAYWRDGRMHCLPAIHDFEAVDTTGAGDNFLTGVVYGLIHDEPLERCLRLGNIFAGNSTTAVGCFGAQITPELIRRYL